MAVVAAAQPSCSSAAATKQARLDTELGGDDCAGATLIPATLLRGGIKNFFSTFGQKRESQPIQKILIRKYSRFFDLF